LAELKAVFEVAALASETAVQLAVWMETETADATADAMAGREVVEKDCDEAESMVASKAYFQAASKAI
jgi:hypothetical protein